MSSEQLVELVYLSAAAQPFKVTELRELLGKSRRNNRAIDVTGLLLHADGSFVQVLEGPAAAVDALFERIATDPRHVRIVRVFRREITSRCFGSWSMGFAEPVAAMRSTILGFNAGGNASTELPPCASDSVRSLIAQFTGGRWRQGGLAEPTESGVHLR